MNEPMLFRSLQVIRASNLFVSALAFIALPGCGTLCNFGVLRFPHQESGPFLVYGGLRIVLWFAEEKNPAFLIDAPLSFGLDTATLPVTLTAALFRDRKAQEPRTPPDAPIPERIPEGMGERLQRLKAAWDLREMEGVDPAPIVESMRHLRELVEGGQFREAGLILDRLLKILETSRQ